MSKIDAVIRLMSLVFAEMALKTAVVAAGGTLTLKPEDRDKAETVKVVGRITGTTYTLTAEPPAPGEQAIFYPEVESDPNKEVA